MLKISRYLCKHGNWCLIRWVGNSKRRKGVYVMKQVRKVLAIVLTLVLTISIIPISNVSAANKVKLNKKKATVYVGKNVILKLKNNNGNVKWSSSNKKVATVSSKGKVKGKRAGKATITAKVGSKKYKCKITVKDIINVKLPKTPFKVSSYEDGILVATYKITNISYSYEKRTYDNSGKYDIHVYFDGKKIYSNGEETWTDIQLVMYQKKKVVESRTLDLPSVKKGGKFYGADQIMEPYSPGNYVLKVTDCYE